MYINDPTERIKNPINYPHKNFSHPKANEAIHTNKGTVTEITFLAKEEMNLVTDICNTLKNRMAKIPKNIMIIRTG